MPVGFSLHPYFLGPETMEFKVNRLTSLQIVANGLIDLVKFCLQEWETRV
jgi:hypothetical protein